MSHPSRILDLVSTAERLIDSHAAHLFPPGIGYRTPEAGA
jgi:hypothetical protein